MLKEGKDPKDKLIEHCRPYCTFWKDKLERCEKKLEYFYLKLIKNKGKSLKSIRLKVAFIL